MNSKDIHKEKCKILICVISSNPMMSSIVTQINVYTDYQYSFSRNFREIKSLYFNIINDHLKYLIGLVYIVRFVNMKGKYCNVIGFNK